MTRGCGIRGSCIIESMSDPMDEIPILEWAHEYNGYERIAGESELMLTVLRPLREAFERDGVIPEWAGVDLLRTWAFCIAREYHWSGGYVPLHEKFPELWLIAEAVNRHPSARGEDRFVKRHPGHSGIVPIIGQVDRDDPADFANGRFAHVLPVATLGRADDDDQRERRLTALLRNAIGIDAARPVARPEIGGWVMLDEAIGTKSTQRLCLQRHADVLILRTWLAELKPQAAALYRTGRAQGLMQLLSERRVPWYARPNVHLAFRNAPGALRLYPHCRLEASEYVRRWSGDDFAWIGAHPRDELRSHLWPWLRNRQYAGPEDDNQVDAFFNRLGRRDVHLRPSLEMTRHWPWAEAVQLDERGALSSDVRSAVAELLSALSEPLPPACVVAPGNK
jgi:hypothetical protein